MTRRGWVQLALAVFLFGSGAIALGGTWGLRPRAQGLLRSALFLASGLLLVRAFLADRERWWPFLAAFALFAVALPGLICHLTVVPEGMGGVLILACLATGFVVPFVVEPQHNWWGLVPGGLLLTMAIAALLKELTASDLATGSAALLGLGLVLIGFYFVDPVDDRHGWWRLVGAGACFSLIPVLLLSGHLPASACWAMLFLGLAASVAATALLCAPAVPKWSWALALGLLVLGFLLLFWPGAVSGASAAWPALLLVAGLALLLATWRGARRGP